MKWEKKRIEEVCYLVTDGKHGDCVNQENSGFFFISAKDIRNWGINYNGARQITSTDFQETHRRTKFEPFDVVVVSTGANIGDIAIAKDIENTYRTTFQKSVAILKANKEKISPYYLAYFLKNSRETLHSISSGSAQKNLLLKDLRKLLVPTPPLPTQYKIASMLSAYDDLIENNLKRIKLLEEVSEIIYNGLFGFFKPTIELNNLPNGWCVQRADEIFRIQIGKTPPREQEEWFNDAESSIKWVSIKDMNNTSIFILNTSETVTENAIKKFNMNIAISETVILSFKLTVGKVAITTEEMVTNEAIAHFNIDDGSKMNSEFIYFYLKNFPYDSLGSTSSIGTAINSKIVKAMPVLLPTEDVINEFGKKVKPYFIQIQTLLKQNAKLKEARDILLPRLMSGEIEV